MKIYHTVENLSDLILQKVSIFYHILTFLGNFSTTVNFVFSNSNMYTCKISMVKAILDIFIETKDAKHYYK